MTTINTARRAFFRGRAVSVEHHMPWAVGAFEDACRRCDACIRACEESILTAGDGGFPTVDFRRGACTFCAACVDACDYAALDRSLSPPWQLTIEIGSGCLSANGITCRACGDSCDEAAIRFQLQTGGRATPTLDAARCNGCGSCISLCPVQVIQIKEAA
ncbi:MAG: ferredoxin-type protein NapF [Gammaproteobacteria bacterium]|nr:ferredoxin-type protein NapF [Gammaproteobacteria bacterium]